MKTIKCRRSSEACKVDVYVTNNKISAGDTFRISGAGRFDGVYTASNIESSVPHCEYCPFAFEHVGIITHTYCSIRRRTGSMEAAICVTDARSNWYAKKITSLDSIMEEL